MMIWVKVFEANDPLQAGMAKVALEAAGLSVQLRRMDLWGVAVEILYSEGATPSVWVPAHQEQSARRILEAQQQMTEAGEDWRCPKCGEVNGGQFGSCWQCGEPAPESS